MITWPDSRIPPLGQSPPEKSMPVVLPLTQVGALAQESGGNLAVIANTQLAQLAQLQLIAQDLIEIKRKSKKFVGSSLFI